MRVEALDIQPARHGVAHEWFRLRRYLNHVAGYCLRSWPRSGGGRSDWNKSSSRRLCVKYSIEGTTRPGKRSERGSVRLRQGGIDAPCESGSRRARSGHSQLTPWSLGAAMDTPCRPALGSGACTARDVLRPARPARGRGARARSHSAASTSTSSKARQRLSAGAERAADGCIWCHWTDLLALDARVEQVGVQPRLQLAGQLPRFPKARQMPARFGQRRRASGCARVRKLEAE